MRNLKVPIFVACLCIVVAVSSSPGAWNFKLPNLNPFAKKQDVPQSRFRNQPEQKSSFLPKINLFPKRAPGEPSTWQKINRGTSNFLSKTKDVLTPWNKSKEMPPQRPRFQGSRRTYSGSPSMNRGSRQEENKPSWVARLNPFRSKNANPEPIDDVNDFFRMERPRY